MIRRDRPPRSRARRRGHPAGGARRLRRAAGEARAAPRARRDAAADALAPARVAPLRAYIRDAWQPLTRTLADLPRAAEDDKVPHAAGRALAGLPRRRRDRGAVAAALARALPARRSRPHRRCARCPAICAAIREPGLLYLPRPYVVPGGRFNEMYGWDSYFIVLGLLRDDKVALARDMVDDFIYEVRHYGGVLNANRTYYLTRSQPPLLSAMVLAVYRATQRSRLAGRHARRARSPRTSTGPRRRT